MPAILLAFVLETQCQGSLEPLPGPGLMAQRSLRDFPHHWAVLNGVGSRAQAMEEGRFCRRQRSPDGMPSRVYPIFIASIFHPGKSPPKPPNDSAFRNRPGPGNGPSER